MARWTTDRPDTPTPPPAPGTSPGAASVLPPGVAQAGRLGGMPDPFGDHPVVLSDDDRDRVQAWVQAVKPQLGLSGWDVAVSRHQCDPGAKASSYVLDKADESVIALAGPLADAEASDLRATLTHELLHCHLQPLIVLVQVMVAGELGKRTEAIMLAAVEQVEERTIERMARAIAELLPFV